MKKVYENAAKKWAIKAGVPMVSAATVIGLIFLYLSMSGAITITGFSGDQVCAGTIEDPCYAYVNFTANEDIFIYPIGYDPWGRNTTFAFSPGVKDWKLQRSWGKNWRDIPLDKTCTGTWCGAPDNKGVSYSWVLREDRDYQVRIVAYKHSPYDVVKWAVNYKDKEYLDPVWESSLEIADTIEDKLLNEDYQNSLRDSDSLRVNQNGKYKSYDSSERILLIENDKYEVLREVQLLSGYKYRASPGEKETIAELFLIDFKSEDVGLFDEIGAYDIKDNFGYQDRQFGLRYATDYIIKDCYVKEGFDNKTNESLGSEIICRNVPGTNWTEFSLLSELPYKGIRVQIFTDTVLGEEIEWVPTIEGVEVLEWASFFVDSLVSYYELNDNLATTNVIDIHGSNDGTLNGGDNTADKSVSGKINTALTFNGIDDYIVKTSFWDTSTKAAISVSVWAKTGGYTSDHPDVIAFVDGTNHLAIRIKPSNVGDPNVGQFLLEGSGVTTTAATGSANLSDDNWHFLVFTIVDDAKAKFYIDGSFVIESSLVIDITSLPMDNLEFGRKNLNGVSFSGEIDEIGIWDRELSADEILDLYNSNDGFAYPFDEICTFSGFVKDEQDNALQGANVTVWNQFDVSEFYEDTTDVNGLWEINITNSTNTYMTGAYFNNSIIGQLKPYISGTC